MDAFELMEEFEEMMDEVRVVRAKRPSASVKRKRHRRYVKKKAQLKRLNKRYRNKPKSKRMAKRRAKLRKRLRIKSGSRRRVYVNSIEFMGDKMSRIKSLTEDIKAIDAFVSKSSKVQMLEAFDSVKILSENMITVLKEAQEKKTLWCAGPDFEGTYTADLDGKGKRFEDRMELEEYIRAQMAKGVAVQWRQYEDQEAFELGESIGQLPEFSAQDPLGEDEQAIMNMLEDEIPKPKEAKQEEPGDEVKPVDMSPILKDLEEMAKTAKKLSVAVKNETIDESDAHDILQKMSQYLDKASHKIMV